MLNFTIQGTIWVEECCLKTIHISFAMVMLAIAPFTLDLQVCGQEFSRGHYGVTK
jgi:hypothetical protein